MASNSLSATLIDIAPLSASVTSYILWYSVIIVLGPCVKLSESAATMLSVNPNNNNNNDNNNDNENVSSTTNIGIIKYGGPDGIRKEHNSPTIRAELLQFVNDDNNNKNNNDNNNDNYSNNHNEMMKNLSLADQVSLLSKQLNVLMTRRREDYELLERNLLKSLRMTQQQQQQQQQFQHKNDDSSSSSGSSSNNDPDLHRELQQLREEVQALHTKHLGGNNERLTIEWLQQSVGELRKQLVELQQIASNALRDITTRTQSWEDLTTIRSDFQQLKLEVAALKERQQQTEIYVQEIREESLQQEEEFMHLVRNNHHIEMNDKKEDKSEPNPTVITESLNLGIDTNDTNEQSELALNLLPNHGRRHCQYQRSQLHEMQLAQRQLKRQLNEIKYQRLGARVRSLEIEQHRIADANFNLSRQVASLDKLHVSMLELLEDVENVQSKVDKNVPELRHEISKLEFSNAQLQSEESVLREENKNLARSVQAITVSINNLSEERDNVKQIKSSVLELNKRADHLQSTIEEIQRSYSNNKSYHNPRSNKRHHFKTNHHKPSHRMAPDNHNLNIENAETLVVKLKSAEDQFESIIDKLPKDCSEIMGDQDNHHTEGLYIIALNGEAHRAMMVHCTKDGWTTVQRRYDGSANFNKSWEEYAEGFGSPAAEFWMGNEHLHQLTLDNCTSLKVVMQDIYDNTWIAEYGKFYVSGRSDGYRLHVTDYSGNASDALNYQQDMQFSAIDKDRDISQTHCAANYEGGWWFSHCQHANLNGRYNLGLTWFDAARNEWIAVKSSQMMVKRLPVESCDNYKIQTDLNVYTVLPTISSQSLTATTTTTTTTTTWPSDTFMSTRTPTSTLGSNEVNILNKTSK